VTCLINFVDVKVVKTTDLGGGSKELVLHGITDTDTFEFILFKASEASNEWLLDELAYIYYKNDEKNAFQIFIQPNQVKEYQNFLSNHITVNN
jgi:hypothetical protein